jgi:hypothetical protein
LKRDPQPSSAGVVDSQSVNSTAAGYGGEDKGKVWVEKTLGWSVDLVERPRKPAPEVVL